jgi:hypothetical protein
MARLQRDRTDLTSARGREHGVEPGYPAPPLASLLMKKVDESCKS